MAVFKCKMCGGDLEIASGTLVAKCEYCGSTQTLPKANDEVIQNLFNRANALRLKCEFDKAEQIYEKIVQENDAEPEAHWGIVLCKYGIEYVEDPKTYNRIPTCHRTSYEAVTADTDYLAAIKYADAAQKSIYETEAKTIDEIQKNILNIVKNEKPFDVFICYKETDEYGKRTVDSAIANDIYYQLTEEGLKVFYAAITLEDKLGQEYEPYIFAALDSAKVMLVIGTQPTYFTAVWVKNEWSRFMKLMKTDRSKLLIPCYKDMDAYELPEEFAHLQAQDMSKIGFINDVVRGIRKLTVKEEPKPKANDNTEPTFVATANNTAPLLKRAFIFLEDGDWAKADDFSEQVLNLDPENAEAYLVKLMCNLKVNKREDLKNLAETFEHNNNYQKIFRFGNDAIKTELTGYIEFIIDRNKKAELARIDAIYNDAKSKMNRASTEADFIKAAQEFYSIKGFLDSNILARECHNKADDFRKEALRITKKRRVFTISFLGVVSLIVAFNFLLNTIIIPNKNYNKAVSLMEEGKYTEAIAAFEAMDGYKDSDDKIIECNYKQAVKLSEEEKYTEAIAAFEAMNGYKDSVEKISECNYKQAVKLMEEEKYIEAIAAFVALSGYKDAKEKALKLWESVAVRNTVSAGYNHTVGLKADGTVVAVGDNYDGQCDVSDWKDIVAVSAGRWHTVGLKADGTVVAVEENYDGQCNVSDWKDIVAVSAGEYHTVGLKSDGTVVAVMSYQGDVDAGQCDVSDWKDIVAISASNDHTVGLKSDGTVVAVGNNCDGQCNVSDWKDIVAVSTGFWYTVGLKADGTVVAVGDNYDGQCDVSDWKDIVAVSACSYHTVGLKSDGTVVAVGHNNFGQCNVSDWKDIVAVSAGCYHTVGLKADGTVVAVGANNTVDLGYGQCDVSGWKDIKLPKKK